jgi:hypothetical protein
MMGKTPKEKEEGARILNNYKKQLAEKLAREKAERGEALSTTSYSKGGKAAMSKISDKKSTKSSKSSKSKQGNDLGSVEAMEPEILLRILHGQGGLGSTAKK